MPFTPPKSPTFSSVLLPLRPRPNQLSNLAAAALTGKRRYNRESGFTLTEVAVAMGIFSFALVSMIGLLSVGLKNSRRANIQISASNLMSAIASDIQSSLWTVKGGTYSYTSPRLKLTASVDSKGTVSGVSPASSILDESGTAVTSNVPNPLSKSFAVNFAAASAGTTAIRVTVKWPATSGGASTVAPEGTLDALIPLPSP
jgi:uncharacterized protein (TIGR02598 family)